MEEHIDAGFGELFKGTEEASKALGGRVLPAPLGLISKAKDDGTVKHRLVQDQIRNLVNSACTILERQVLPRHTDHARDIALLSRSKNTVRSRQDVDS